MDSVVIHGNCLQEMHKLENIDSIVSDPPYGLNFMGKEWDHGVPGVPFWKTALQICKPGAYLLAFGGTRTYHRLAVAIEDAGWEIRDCLMWLYGTGFPKGKSVLKPGWEPIVLAQKKLEESIEKNFAKYGTGMLNISGCRIGEGRWPANVIIDEEVAKEIDSQSGITKSAGGRIGKKEMGVVAGAPAGKYEKGDPGFGDIGGASRFFYCAKASRKEREAGLEGMPQKESGGMSGTADGSLLTGSGNVRNNRAANHHPTVKPINLMRYLCRLVTPVGGTVLDPFCGSGTTGIAAKLEGFNFVGIELEEDYVEIARKRIAHYA